MAGRPTGQGLLPPPAGGARCHHVYFQWTDYQQYQDPNTDRGTFLSLRLHFMHYFFFYEDQ